MLKDGPDHHTPPRDFLFPEVFLEFCLADALVGAIDGSGGEFRIGIMVKRSRKGTPPKKADLHQEIRHLGVLVERTDHNVSVIAEQYGDIKADIGGMKNEIGGIKSDIGGIKGEIGGIKADIGGMKSEIGGIKSDIGGIKKTLDSHTEMIGNLTVNLEIVKNDVEFIKQGMKRKVDAEEFSALERRVALLEKRVTQK